MGQPVGTSPTSSQQLLCYEGEEGKGRVFDDVNLRSSHAIQPGGSEVVGILLRGGPQQSESLLHV